MKKQLLFSLMLATLSSVSVSCSASPPPVDVGIHESIIKQSPVTLVEEAMAVTNYLFRCVTVIEEQTLYVTNFKRQPIVQSVCSTDALVMGVDGRAVLSWRIKDYNYQVPKLGFRYSEGRATEYRS